MATVSWYGQDLSSVFGLLGTHEPALTRALGWTMARSPRLMRAILERLDLDPNTATSDVTVLLEDADELGRTDIEVRTPSAHIIIEAKVGWIVPGAVQLEAYAARFTTIHPGLERANDGNPVAQRLVTLSDSSPQWAGHVLPGSVAGAPVTHWSWDTIRDLIAAAIINTRGAERLWLDQLEDYLGSATSSRPVTDALAYCVVISDEIFGGVSFRDYVTKQRTYFHPIAGGGWPTVPPNFFAFRWGNALRQLNRVESFEVVAHLSERFPAVTDDHSAESRPPEAGHFVYHLGPDIPLPAGGIPSGPVGTNLRAQRFWVLLDQLLTQTTLVDAREATKKLGGS